MADNAGIIVTGHVPTKLRSDTANSLVDVNRDKKIDKYDEFSTFHVNFIPFSKQSEIIYRYCVVILLSEVPTWLKRPELSPDDLLLLWSIEFEKFFDEEIQNTKCLVSVSPPLFEFHLISSQRGDTTIRSSFRYDGIKKDYACEFARVMEIVGDRIEKLPIFRLLFPGDEEL